MVCLAANSAGIEVCLCGEMAGEPNYALVLLGLGLHELSMNPASIPRVKRVIRRLSKSDGEALLQELMQLKTAKEVSSHLDKKMRDLLPDIFEQSLI
jgi:phosphotransferase system enzyme I (PtsI)